MSMSNEALLEHKIKGHELDATMVSLFIERMLDQSINGSQVAAMLALLRAHGVSARELGYFADVVIKKAVPIVRPSYLYADIVGTGGDGHNTINVSTLASLTAAFLGVPVAKHGNVSVSSKCGAADVLQKLGVDLTLDAHGVRKSLDTTNWAFLFAPNFHPTYQAAKAVRKDLGIKTVFNILGPLVNPLAPPIMVIGVYHEDLLMPFAQVLKSLKRKKALIVHGSGLDEIALHGPTQALLLDNDAIEPLIIEPKSIGLKSFLLNDIKGGDPEENARICRAVLAGTAPDAHISLVAASAGALLWLAGKHATLKDAVLHAYEVLQSGQAIAMLDRLTRFDHGTS